MKLSFYPKFTEDGSLGLFNTDVDDIYHSSYGAYTEAVNKFVVPSGIREFAKKNNQVRILDVCSGMGYNYKTALDEILKANQNCSVEIDCLEIDSYVFAFGLLYKVRDISYELHYFLIEKFFDNERIRNCMIDLMLDDNFTSYIDEKLASFLALKLYEQIDLIGQGQNNSKIHNIYYKYKSIRHKNPPKNVLKLPNVQLSVHIDDARAVVQKLGNPYDFIFHDGFTPSKQSILWTYEFFSRLKHLLSEDGNISTYSSSAIIRSAMLQNGFYLGKIQEGKRKTSGTIAYMSEKFVSIPLSQKEIGLLSTRAGIVYHDENFDNTHDEIIQNRNLEVKKSKLPSSSSYLKNYERQTYE